MDDKIKPVEVKCPLCLKIHIPQCKVWKNEQETQIVVFFVHVCCGIAQGVYESEEGLFVKVVGSNNHKAN